MDCPDCRAYLKEGQHKCMCGWREKAAPKRNVKSTHACHKLYEPLPQPIADPAKIRAHIKNMKAILNG